jgi:outer membrane receptor protein involved in Fe transport
VDLLDRAQIESVINGKIDELHLLPTAGFAYRPLPGVSWKASWSQTVARPSFREMGFYASLDPDTDDQVVGNPQLELSEVTSYDTRIEYTWGELGDFISVSPFYKVIENPIESILVHNPIQAGQADLWRTWFNNPNTANLWGIEIEARKYLDFIPLRFAEFLSIGGNYTYISAEVDRSDAELNRSAVFFRTAPGDEASYTGLESSRRLFGQPEWIVNADVSFAHPDWGTKATLAYFAISDVLDAAGSAAVGPDGRTLGLRLDRYLDSYGQLDLVLSQSWSPGFLRGGSLTFKASLKNLTDSTRGRFYDPDQTHEKVYDRRYKLGRTYKFGITYSY